MPIEIIEKPKTKPQHINQHKMLVPLRVAEILAIRCHNDARREAMVNAVFVKNICMGLPDQHGGVSGVFNCTFGAMIERDYLEYITFTRAYDVAQIILTNDNEPAPVL